jgi:hypothetical protein
MTRPEAWKESTAETILFIDDTYEEAEYLIDSWINKMIMFKTTNTMED